MHVYIHMCLCCCFCLIFFWLLTTTTTQVGRPVAERGVRVVDADLRRRRSIPGVGHVGAVRGDGPAGGPAAGLLALVAPYPGELYIFIYIHV